jgi:uncharacterized protein (DUF1330 family)
MPAYMIVDIVSIKDAALCAQYIDAVAATVSAYGGRYLARGGTITPLSGGWTPARVIVMEFPSIERIRTWLGSPEYRKLAPWRKSSIESRSIVLEGCTEDAPPG